MSNNTQRQTMTDYSKLDREELIERIESLEAQLDESEAGWTRRSVLAGALGVASAGAAGIWATGTASAAPSGSFPAETDDPLLKTRVDRVRYVTRSSAPPAPSSGRVLTYVDEGDLP